MVWLKVAAELPRHAKLYKLARQLKIHRREALAYIVQLWAFVVLNYPDGNINASPDEIAFGVELDDALDPNDFVNALCDCALPNVGFLERVGNGIYHVHDWDEFSGSLEIAKAKNREKLRVWREKQKNKEAEGNENVTVTEPLQNRSVTPEKKKEKEKKKESTKNSGGFSGENPQETTGQTVIDPWAMREYEHIKGVVKSPKPANLPILILQWGDQYGRQKVEEGIAKSLRWMQDNGRRYQDMGRFIGGWIARDAEKTRPNRVEKVDYGETLPSWDELRGTR